MSNNSVPKKKILYVPISLVASDVEYEINSAIANLEQRDNTISFLTDLCRPTDPLKYMLVYESSREQPSPYISPVDYSIGVKVVATSENIYETEEILNHALHELNSMGIYNFVSISHPSEFIYIILYQCRAGSFPTVKMFPVVKNAFNASGFSTLQMEKVYEDPKFANLEPFDSFMVDDINLLMLFG